MDQIVGPQFNGTADYDCIVQATFRDVKDFVRMKSDPFFKEKVTPDHENFADTVRSKYVSQHDLGNVNANGVQDDCRLD